MIDTFFVVWSAAATVLLYDCLRDREVQASIGTDICEQCSEVFDDGLHNCKLALIGACIDCEREIDADYFGRCPADPRHSVAGPLRFKHWGSA